jgi:hypothetical protein
VRLFLPRVAEGYGAVSLDDEAPGAEDDRPRGSINL